MISSSIQPNPRGGCSRKASVAKGSVKVKTDVAQVVGVDDVTCKAKKSDLA